MKWLVEWQRERDFLGMTVVTVGHPQDHGMIFIASHVALQHLILTGSPGKNIFAGRRTD